MSTSFQFFWCRHGHALLTRQSNQEQWSIDSKWGCAEARNYCMKRCEMFRNKPCIVPIRLQQETLIQEYTWPILGRLKNDTSARPHTAGGKGNGNGTKNTVKSDFGYIQTLRRPKPYPKQCSKANSAGYKSISSMNRELELRIENWELVIGIWEMGISTWELGIGNGRFLLVGLLLAFYYWVLCWPCS